jgi:hypothetical protein
VRVLLDESLPRQIASELSEFEVDSVHNQKWTGLSNGELLRKAEASGFDVFLTADQNLQYQQNLSKGSIRVVIISARSNRIQDIMPLVPDIKAAINTVKPTQAKVVGG